MEMRLSLFNIWQEFTGLYSSLVRIETVFSIKYNFQVLIIKIRFISLGSLLT